MVFIAVLTMLLAPPPSVVSVILSSLRLQVMVSLLRSRFLGCLSCVIADLELGCLE